MNVNKLAQDIVWRTELAIELMEHAVTVVKMGTWENCVMIVRSTFQYQFVNVNFALVIIDTVIFNTPDDFLCSLQSGILRSKLFLCLSVILQVM